MKNKGCRDFILFLRLSYFYYRQNERREKRNEGKEKKRNSLEKQQATEFNSNSSINLTVTSRHVIAKEESTESYSSGTNLARFFETKLANGDKRKADSGKPNKTSVKNVQICLNDCSEQVASNSTINNSHYDTCKSVDTPSANLTATSTLFSGIIGHKRSFACDSNAASCLNNNVSIFRAHTT